MYAHTHMSNVPDWRFNAKLIHDTIQLVFALLAQVVKMRALFGKNACSYKLETDILLRINRIKI
jgi:hypothetical protein